jgi:membrane-associated phospholipid phosphatase
VKREAGLRLATAFIALCLCLGFAQGACAQAQEGEPSLRWSPSFTRFGATQYALSAALVGGLLARDAWLQPTASAGWSSDNPLDTQARTVFAARSAEGRASASSVSDVLSLGLMLYPLAIDSVLVAGVAHTNPDVAFQMAMIGTQAILMSKLISGLTKSFVGRARPDSSTCLLGTEPGCSARNESFVSGHTSAAFVGAGLMCAQHQNLALYGQGPWGAVACGLSLTAATAVGVLRMMADRHHLTDVLGGAAIGLASGYLLPNLLNYDFGASKTGHAQLFPFGDTRTLGVAYRGTF